jgi:hypothetical protein
MPALCALPVVGVAPGFSLENIGNLATIGLFLACPLSHMFLMKHDTRGDHKYHKDNHEG